MRPSAQNEAERTKQGRKQTLLRRHVEMKVRGAKRSCALALRVKGVAVQVVIYARQQLVQLQVVLDLIEGELQGGKRAWVSEGP